MKVFVVEFQNLCGRDVCGKSSILDVFKKAKDAVNFIKEEIMEKEETLQYIQEDGEEGDKQREWSTDCRKWICHEKQVN